MMPVMWSPHSAHYLVCQFRLAYFWCNTLLLSCKHAEQVIMAYALWVYEWRSYFMRKKEVGVYVAGL